MVKTGKRNVDRLVNLLMVVGVGLLAFFIFRDQFESTKRAEIREKTASEVAVVKPVKNPYLRYRIIKPDPQELYRDLSQAHTFKNLADLDKLCRGLLQVIGLPEDGSWLPTDQILTRTEYKQQELEWLNKNTEYEISQTPASNEHLPRLRKLYDFFDRQSAGLIDPMKADDEIARAAEIAASLVEDGLEGVTVSTYHLASQKDFHAIKKIGGIRELAKDVQELPALVRFTFFRQYHNFMLAFDDRPNETAAELLEYPDAEKKIDYLILMDGLQGSIGELIQSYSSLGWTSQECWQFISHRMKPMTNKEKLFCLPPEMISEIDDMWLKHVVLGTCLSFLPKELYLISSQSESGFREERQKCVELQVQHFQSAWLLEPMNAIAPAMLLDLSLTYAETCFSPEVWLTIVSHADAHYSSAFRTFGSSGVRWMSEEDAFQYAQKCVDSGAFQTEIPFRGMAALVSQLNARASSLGALANPRVVALAQQCGDDLAAWVQTE